MSILIEGITVAVQNKTIDRHIYGGVAAYRENVPNATFRTDGLLAAASFMDPSATKKFVATLEEVGMVFVANDVAHDISVIDQNYGPTAQCDWINFSKNIEGISFAWLKDTAAGEIVFYENWSPGVGLVLKEEGVGENIKFLRRENDLDVYVDIDTGQELYTVRRD